MLRLPLKPPCNVEMDMFSDDEFPIVAPVLTRNQARKNAQFARVPTSSDYPTFLDISTYPTSILRAPQPLQHSTPFSGPPTQAATPFSTFAPIPPTRQSSAVYPPPLPRSSSAPSVRSPSPSSERAYSPTQDCENLLDEQLYVPLPRDREYDWGDVEDSQTPPPVEGTGESLREYYTVDNLQELPLDDTEHPAVETSPDSLVVLPHCVSAPGWSLTTQANTTATTGTNTTTVLSRPVEDKMDKGNVPSSLLPEPFKGNSSDDAGLWLRRFEIYVQLKGWGPLKALTAFPMFLRDGAAIWYDSLDSTHKLTFDKLKEAFSARFEPHESMRWIRLDEFNARTQKSGETVEAYLQDMLKRGHDLEKSEAEIMETVVRGFLPKISLYVKEKAPTTMTEALNYARVAQSFRVDKVSSPDKEVATIVAKIAADVKKEVHKQLATVQMPQSGRPPRGPPQQQGQQSRPPPFRQVAFTQSAPRGPFSGRNPFNNAPQGNQFSRPFRQQPPPQRQQQVVYGQRTIICFACGRFNHIARDCPYSRVKCHFCGQIGHLQKMCRLAAQNSQ